VVWPRPGGGI